MLDRNGPLKGIRVIEMAGLGPVPFSCMQMADLGAEVVRVARPGWRFPFPIEQKFNIYDRCRRTLTLDLREEEGQEQLWQLIDRAGILVEGYRPGVMEKIGFGPDTVLERRPSLVYGRMTGWGQSGPLSQAAGHDLNYAAISGAIWSIGSKELPPPPPLNVIADLAGGGMMLTVGVLAASLHARGTGEGQVVDTAMSDGSALLMAAQYGFLSAGLWNDNERGANFMNGGVAWYGCYETKDKGFISVGCLEPQFFARFLELTGLSDDPLFQQQHDLGAQPEMQAALESLFRTRTRREWCDLLEGSDACFAPVLSMSEAPSHPHNLARETFVETDGVVQPAPAPRFSATPTDHPTHGDTGSIGFDDILRQWGDVA
jgi:alpha-methylacyl-CoA racemase